MLFAWKKFWRNTRKGCFLIYLNFKVKLYRFFLFFKEKKLIKHLPRFRKVDERFIEYYKGQNPFLIAKVYALENGWKDPYGYGETPLTTIDAIVQAANIRSDDHFYELGSGRGRPLFFVAEKYECQSTGIEIIPHFVKKARSIALECACPNVNFIKTSFDQVEYQDATIIYFYGTGMPDSLIEKLSDCLYETISKDCQIITISFPLTDYRPKKFRVKKSIEVEFEWGATTAYYQVKL